MTKRTIQGKIAHSFYLPGAGKTILQKHKAALILLLGLLFLSILAWAEDKQAYLEINLEMNKEVFPVKVWGTTYPSYAVWVAEEESGKTVTVYASKKLGFNKWIGAKARPSAAPVWEGVKAKEEGFRPDAVSSATPKESQVLKWPVPKAFAGKKLEVYLEANCSFDYNERYPKSAKKGEANYSKYNGQPSLIWKAAFTAGENSIGDLKPAIIGHGHVLGENHDIDPDVSKITTAKEIFRKMEFNYVVD